MTERLSWQTAFIVLGAVCLACAVYFWAALPPSQNFRPARIPLRESLGAIGECLAQPVLRALCFIGFLVMGAYIMLLDYVGYPLTGALLTLVPGLWVKIGGIAVFAFGFFAAHTVASGWIGVAAPAERKATASLLYLLFYYAGSSIVGWAGGYVWSGAGWPGLIGAICLLLAVCYGLSIVASQRAAMESPAMAA